MDEEWNFDLKALTPAEQIWLWRRRQASTNGRARGRGGAKMSANEAASVLAVRVEDYCAAERGENPGIALDSIRERGEPLRRPSPGEGCALARRRAAAPVEEICAALGGISKPTFYAREAAGDPELVALWRERGFSF